MKIKVLVTALSMVLLSSCAALDEYMDSSVGPEGHQQTAKPQSNRSRNSNSAASVSQNTTNTSSRNGTQSSSSAGSASGAGVIKPFVPQEESVQSSSDEGSLKMDAKNISESQVSLSDDLLIPAPSQQSPKVSDNESLPSADVSAEQKPSEPEVIDVQSSSNSQPVLTIPEYAQTQNLHGSCSDALNDKVQQAAKDLGAELGTKLKADSGSIYVAPTVIPDEYSDCVRDAAPSVKSTIENGGKFTVAQTGGVMVSQNIGSAVVIPSLIRECKKQSIPYLAYTLLAKRGGKVRLTLRIIRVNDGITLTQNYKNLE